MKCTSAKGAGKRDGAEDGYHEVYIGPIPGPIGIAGTII